MSRRACTAGDSSERFVVPHFVGKANQHRVYRGVRHLTGDADPQDPPPDHAETGPVAIPHWLLRARVEVPAAPRRYCERPNLAHRCAPARNAATVLMAPAGFGKTTLLAAACRDAKRASVPVAWLTLADDDPASLDTYLAYAFRQAGLDPDSARPAPIDAAYPRTATLLHAIDARGDPCVLALDELEGVAHPGSVALLNFLLRHAPPCLHLALAYRRLPPGLDAFEQLLARGAERITAADLRFSTPDIARFFDLALSRRELATMAVRTGGWPIALQMFRNIPQAPSTDEEPVARDAVASWIAGRFWRGFEARDRELVFDLALFDWLDADLVEEVLEAPGALARATALPGLAGLLHPTRGKEGGYRLHPLLREHCAEECRTVNAVRWRTVKRRLAAALARRGATVDAMRHAVEASDSRLAGTILIEAGGVQIWLREGADRLAAADRYLTDDAVATDSRLAMARSVALLFDGRPSEANQVFDGTSRAASDDTGYALDRTITHAFLLLSGSCPDVHAELETLAGSARQAIAYPGTPRVTRGAMLFGFAARHVRHGEFAAADSLAEQARREVVGRSAYLTILTDSLLGQSAMARGRVGAALARYRDARRIAREHFLEDPRLGATIDVHTGELALERNRLSPPSGLDAIIRVANRVSAYFANFAATGLATELAVVERGIDAALSLLGDLAEHAHRAGLRPLIRHLAALRVSILAEAGRISEAEGVWHAAALPLTPAGCLDMEEHTWRGTETLACARIRLLAGLGDRAGAATLERALANQSDRLGLRRTLFRSLALRVRLRHDARDPDAARDAAAEYLRLFRTTDYARPLLVTGKAATSALERILDANSDGPDAPAARRLIAMARMGGTTPVPPLDARETAVLRLLPHRQDKEIARILGLSVDGVRYHLRKIFRKFAVTSREEAVRCARALGILPEPNREDL